MTSPPDDSGTPLPAFGALVAFAGNGGATGHPVLDAVLAGLADRTEEGAPVVAYYEDAP
ncbi:YxD-tail cyclophane-containing RiPP peptide [Streptomyces sp. NPDC015127]|uniref:YxD-tail cyclophane-containing RiPP peptide n=1 Tax=Streptomyces sp. NPDC015127 TaxID=3364939 RepID=UPI003701FAF2